MIPLQAGVPPRAVDIDADHLRAGIPAADGPAGLVLARLHLHFETKPAAAQGEPALGVNLAAADIALPGGPAWALGPTIASIGLDGMLTGPLPRAPDLTTRATGWRNGGGTLELRRVAVEWGPLDLSASATLALDDRMQPMGAGTARIVGEAETLDALAAANAIAPRAALAAKAVLGLMAHAPPDGGPPQVDVPLTLQNRALSVGRIPLLRLPELFWPEPL